jgi:cytidylate kinase
MGSVVFPDATLKIFLTADAAERARRRYKQLMEKGLSASMDALLQEIRDRDARDSSRAAAPLQKCSDAIELDTTGMSADEAVARVLTLYKARATKAP